MATSKKSILAAFGSGFLKVFGLLFPVLIAATPAGPTNDLLSGIFGIIGTIERAFSQLQAQNPGEKFGPQKLQAALPLVKDLLLNSSLIAGHKLVDEQAFTDACTGLINDSVKLLNSVEHPNG